MKKIISLLTAVCFTWSVLAGNVYAYADYGTNKEDPLKITGFSEPAISGDLGTITEGSLFPDSKYIVVNIQDLHCNPEVQKNISGILSDIDNKYGLKNVYVEGAYSDISTAWLCDIENKYVKKDVLNVLLQSGRLTGAEYYSASENKPALIKGIEDKRTHQDNIVRLNDILQKQDIYKKELLKLDKELGIMQAKYFNSKNKEFNRMLKGYENGSISLKKYYSYIIKSVNYINRNVDINNSIYAIDINKYPNVAKHIELMNLTDKLNHEKVSLQLASFIGQLKEKLPYGVYKDLLEKTNNFSKINDLYVYIPNILNTYDITLSDGYSELKVFFDCTRKEKELNVLSLIREEKLLTEKIRIGFSQDINELEVSFLSDFYTYFKNYIAASITPDDYMYFIDKISDFERFWSKYTVDSAINNVSKDFAVISDYYDANFKRDVIFKSKLELKENKTNYPSVNVLSLSQNEIKKILQKAELAVIVTGGFHSEGLKRQMDEQKISHITITPNIALYNDSEKNYNELVKIQANLFAGQALALALGSTNAQITVENKIVKIDLNGEKLELILNELTGNYELIESVDVVYAAESILTDTVRKEILSGFNNIRGLVNPLESASVIYALVESAALFGVNKGILAGNGLIWEIAGNESLQQAIKENSNVAINEVAMLPEFMQKIISGKTMSEMQREISDKPVLLALSQTPEFSEFIKSISAKETSKNAAKADVSRIMKKILTVFLSFILVLMMVSCGQQGSKDGQDSQETEIVLQQGEMISNDYVRQVAAEFLQGNPLPRSFIGETEHILNTDQKMIAEEGLIIYDMAVLIKALMLYPEKNKDLIDEIVKVLATGKDMRSNNDFKYDRKSVGVGKGYFWKIVSTNGTWLKNQSMPITGENAWLASSMVLVYEAYKGTETGNHAYAMLVDITEAMLALQTEGGLIKMAPKNNIDNYEYAGIDYNNTVSVENNISVLPVLRYMADYGPKEERERYRESLVKLERALIGMYNKEEGYFNTGMEISSGDINTVFADRLPDMDDIGIWTEEIRSADER